MPRSKKGAGQPPPKQDPPDSDAHDAAENEGMAHVGADALSGSPDIFASKRASSHPEPVPGSSSLDEPVVTAEPPAPAPEPEVAPAPIATMEPVPSISPAPSERRVPPAPPARRGSSGVAIGIVLVVVGLFYL